MDINLIKQVVVTNRNLLSSIDLVRRDVDLDDSINYVFTIDNFYDCKFEFFYKTTMNTSAYSTTTLFVILSIPLLALTK